MGNDQVRALVIACVTLSGLVLAAPRAHAVFAGFSDFSNDGFSDILWRNSATGENYIYPMNGTAILAGEGYLRTVADQNWKIVGIGNFDGFGGADILWRNSSTGENYLYLMNGTAIVGEGFIRTVADPAWQVAGVGDFNADGRADILWRNGTTGENYIYLMNGTTIAGEGYLRTVADLSWQIAGVGDFDGDGKADVLWRNGGSGQNYIYPMNGTAILASEGYLRTVADQNWKIVGIGNFDGFGGADILWRNSSTGENYLYPMNGTAILGTEGYVRTVSNLSWKIVAAGDYDGDGKADVFWRHATSGENYLYFMDGTTIKPTEGYTRTVPDQSWSVVGGGSLPPNSVPRFAYVANAGDDSVSIYTVNALTGQLRHNGFVAAGANPRSVTVEPSGKFAYVTNRDSGNVSAYTINAATGALTAVVGSPFTAGDSPSSLTVDPSGKFAYLANQFDSHVSAYTINAATGALTAVAGSPFAAGSSPRSVTVDPSGKFAYVANLGSNNVSAYTIDAATGALTPIDADPATAGIQNFAAGSIPISVTVDPSGRFAYVGNQFSNGISAYTIDAATGALTPIDADPATAGIQNFAAGTDPVSVGIDPSGKFAYMANLGSNSVSAHAIDATTGALTAVAGSPFAAGTDPVSVSVDPSGKFAYVANNGSSDVSAYAIDATTGALTSLGTVRARSSSASIAVTKGTAPVIYTPRFAYVTNSNANSVSAYTIDAGTGALTPVDADPATPGTQNFPAQASPRSVSVHPSGRFAYVANTNSADLSAYTINATTGALTPNGGPVFSDLGPTSITVDPAGRFAYVANNDTFTNTVSVYTINVSGTLSPIGFMAAGTDPRAVTVDPAGKFLYVANFGTNNVSAYLLDGTFTKTDFPAGSNPHSVTVHPSGRFVYVANQTSSNVSAYTIDAATGALTPIDADAGAAGIQNFPTGASPRSVAVDPSGKFAYVAGSSGVSAFTINAATGALTPIDADPATPGIQTFAAGNAPGSVSVDPSGKFAYVANLISNDVSAYTINASTGALTSVGAPTPSAQLPWSITTTGTIQ